MKHNIERTFGGVRPDTREWRVMCLYHEQVASAVKEWASLLNFEYVERQDRWEVRLYSGDWEVAFDLARISERATPPTCCNAVSAMWAITSILRRTKTEEGFMEWLEKSGMGERVVYEEWRRIGLAALDLHPDFANEAQMKAEAERMV